MNCRVTLSKEESITALAELMCISESQVLNTFPGIEKDLLGSPIFFDRRFVCPDVRRDTLIVKSNQYFSKNRFVYYIDMGKNPPELYDKFEKFHDEE